MNYLELVNLAIQESGIDLDDLTSVNFASPPRTIMYTRMKNWVNRAYREILLKREEWYVLNERTVLTVYPRIRVTDVANPILVGDELQGQDSGVRFVVVAVYADPLDPDADVFLDVEYTDLGNTHPIVGELLDRLTVVPTSDIALLESAAGTDFTIPIPTLREIDLGSMLVQEVPDSTLNNSNPGTPQPVWEIKWEDWYTQAIPDFTYMSKPMYVTRGPDGLIEFWPRLDIPYQFLFSYSRTIPTMVDYDDTPWPIPEDFQMAIVWRAVMKYARYDRKDKLYLDARDEFRFYNNKLEENKLPEPVMGGNQFWA